MAELLVDYGSSDWIPGLKAVCNALDEGGLWCVVMGTPALRFHGCTRLVHACDVVVQDHHMERATKVLVSGPLKCKRRDASSSLDRPSVRRFSQPTSVPRTWEDICLVPSVSLGIGSISLFDTETDAQTGLRYPTLRTLLQTLLDSVIDDYHYVHVEPDIRELIDIHGVTEEWAISNLLVPRSLLWRWNRLVWTRERRSRVRLSQLPVNTETLHNDRFLTPLSWHEQSSWEVVRYRLSHAGKGSGMFDVHIIFPEICADGQRAAILYHFNEQGCFANDEFKLATLLEQIKGLDVAVIVFDIVPNHEARKYRNNTRDLSAFLVTLDTAASSSGMPLDFTATPVLRSNRSPPKLVPSYDPATLQSCFKSPHRQPKLPRKASSYKAPVPLTLLTRSEALRKHGVVCLRPWKPAKNRTCVDLSILSVLKRFCIALVAVAAYVLVLEGGIGPRIVIPAMQIPRTNTSSVLLSA